LGVVDELALLFSNIKKEVCGILDFFFSFFNKHEKNSLYIFLDVRP
jgi:hypothetical protein